MNLNFKQWLEAAAIPAVLAATGAYNPVHKGHVRLFYSAKRYLLNKGYDVVAAYMIPRNFDYIVKKSKEKGETPMPDEHRQTMINMALQGTFIKMLPLEQNTSNLNNQEIRNEINKLHPGAEIIFVAGDDKGGCADNEDVCLQNHPRLGKVVIVGRKLAFDASSTTVRNQLKSTGNSPLLRNTISDYIRKNQLWSQA